MSNAISQFLEERIGAGDFPSASWLVAEKGEIRFSNACGLAAVEPERTLAAEGTIYDLASLTKVLVTGALAARAIERKDFGLSDQVSRFFPGNGKLAAVTIGQLLSHTSGLEAWRPFYLFTAASLSRSEIKTSVRDQIFECGLMTAPGTHVTYSDLNFILLGFILEQIYGEDIERLFYAFLASPLDLFDTFPGQTGDRKLDTAASETGNAYEAQTCREMFPEIAIPAGALRTGPIRGEVHDGNAFFMGGFAGHAGLFSTAYGVFRLAAQFLARFSETLDADTCGLFRTNLTPGLNGDRSAAFQLASTDGSTAGSLMSPESFGHTGFTGTSLWIDPVKERIFILLTNRTHHHPLPFANINSTRRRFHDIAIELLEA